jgi:hypothetical protein
MKNDGNFVDIILPYVTENTVRVHYDDRSVNAVRENNRVYCEGHTKPATTMCGKMHSFIMLL